MFNEQEYIDSQLKLMDQELASEEEIKEKAKDIVRSLKFVDKVQVEHEDQIYEIAMKETYYQNQRYVILVAVNEQTRQRSKILNKPYIPATYKGEYNNEFTQEENYKAVIEAFLHHIKGNIQVGEVE